MKNGIKRTISLALCAVLLLGSVPFEALATEEIEEEVLEEIEEEVLEEFTEIQVPETQTAKTNTLGFALVMKNVANENLIPQEVVYPVRLNGMQLTDMYNSGVVGWNQNERFSYNADKKVLTLENVDITATAPNTAIETTEDLTIELIGTNKLTIEEGTEGNRAAIYAQKNITIQGEGSLEIVSNSGAAIYVLGTDNPEGTAAALTIQGDVMVSVTNTSEREAILAPNGVKIGEGSVHLKAGKTLSGDKYTLPAGYMKTEGKEGFDEATNEWTADGGAFEFVAASHLTYIATDTQHILKCNDECELEKATVLTEDHSKNQEGDREAGCGNIAFCSVCKLEYGEVVEAHLSTDTKFEKVDDSYHKKVYECCKAEKVKEQHELTYANTNAGTTITAECSVRGCGADGSITLTAEGGEWNGDAYSASYGTPSGVLSGEKPDIIYTNTADGSTSKEAPTAIGDYTASIMVKEKTVAVNFSITKIDISKADVEVAEGNYVYSGNAYTPAVTVTLNGELLTAGEDYTVLYDKNIDATEEATAIITATETSNYIGEAKGTFTIAPKGIKEDDVRLDEKELIYNGKEQTLNVVKVNSDVTFEVENNKQTNADNYKLIVYGTGNYDGTVELDYTIAPAKPNVTVKAEQIIAAGAGDFEEPVFLGVDGKPIPGSMEYAYKFDTGLDFQTVKERLAMELKVGDPATERLAMELKVGDPAKEIEYTFVPTTSGNYVSEALKGTISITVKNVKFYTVEGKEITDEAVLVDHPVYGEPDIVKVTQLVATSEGKTDSEDSNFKVVYIPAGSSESSDKPSVGNNAFTIYYNGNVNGVYCKDLLVYSSQVEVGLRPVLIQAKPADKHLTVLKCEGELSESQNLIDKIEVTDPASGAEIEYRISNGTWSENVPQKAEAGRYTVEYKISAPNYETKTGSVTTLIQPELTATYGENLSDVDIPADGKWKWALNDSLLDESRLEEHPVGHYGVNDSFQMVYEDSEPFTVYLTINAKPVEPIIKADDCILYSERDKITVRVYDGDTELDKEEYQWELNELQKRTGKTTITVEDAKADNDYAIATKTKDVLIYRPGYNTFTAISTSSDLEDTENYNTAAKVKAALSDKIKSTNYPESAMKYYNVLMTYWGTQNGKTTWIGSRDETYFPKGGFEIEIPYSALGIGIDENNDFKVSIMDAETSADLGTTAGSEPEEIKNFVKTETGIKFHSDGCSVVCIAVEGDPNNDVSIPVEGDPNNDVSIPVEGDPNNDVSIPVEGDPNNDVSIPVTVNPNTVYTITKVVSPSSSYGTVSTKANSKTVSEAKMNTKISVTAKAKTGYTLTSVKVTDASSNAVEITKVSEGNYEFIMPASNVTVTATFAKNTANSNTGDSSHIYLWATVMAVSGLCAAALIGYYFKKRKK